MAMLPLSSKRPTKRTVLRWVAWFLGLGLIVFLVHRVGGETVLAALWQVGPRVLLLAAAYAASLVVMAIPFHWFLSPATRPPFQSTVGGRFAASGLNALLPLMNAGEPSRLLWLARAHWSEGLAALIVDRLTFAGASLMWIAIGATATLHLPGFPRILSWEVLAVALGLLALGVGLGAWWRPSRVLALLIRMALGIWRRLGRQGPVAADQALTERLHDRLEGLFRQPGKLAGALLVHVLARFVAAMEIYLALAALGANPTLAVALALSAVPVALALVGGLVPGQVGVQEGSVAVVAAAIGVGASTGLAVVLLQRVRQILFLPVTGLLLASRSHDPPSPPTNRAAGNMRPSLAPGNAALPAAPAARVEGKGPYLFGPEDPP